MDNLKAAFQNLGVNDAKFNEICFRIADDLKDNKYKILALVEDLQVYMTSPEKIIRSGAIQVLSSVLEKIPNDLLNDAESVHLWIFYQNLLVGASVIIPPALKGIVALIDQKQLPDRVNLYRDLLKQIFLNVSCQSHPYTIRLDVYKIFKKMLEHKTEDLFGSDSSYVYGVLSAMDGEKDPNNLIFLFNWLPTFFKTVSMDHLNEDMFEIISCYFPVDYQKPSGFANSVSRDELADSLAPCLVAIPYFAEFCLPLIVEKLQSSHQTAQLDSLKLLILSCQTFPDSAYMTDNMDILLVLRHFVMNQTNFHEEAFVAVTKVSEKIGEQPERFKYLDKNLESLQNNLSPTSKHFKIAWRFLLALTRTEWSSKYLNLKVQAILVNIYNLGIKYEEAVFLLNVLTELLKIGYGYEPSLCEDQIFKMILSIISDPQSDLTDVAINTFSELSEYVREDIRLVLYENLKTVLINKRLISNSNKFAKCFMVYADRYPKEVTLNILKLSIPKNDNEFECLMWNLSLLCRNPEYSLEFVKRLEQNFDNETICLASLKNAMLLHPERKLCEDLCKSLALIDEIMDFDKCATGDLQSRCEILMRLMALLTAEEQCEYIRRYFKEALKKSLDKTETYLDYYIAFIVKLHPEVLEDFRLIDVLFNINNVPNAVQLLSNMLNKLPVELIDGKLIEFYDKCKVSLESGLMSDHRISENVVLWITKALVMRGHHFQDQWIDLLFEYCMKSNSPNFQISIKEDDTFLSTSSYCRIRLFYRQYFFERICPKLEGNVTDLNPVLYSSFGILISEIPLAVLKQKFKKVLRLILVTMENSSDDISLISILNTIKTLLETKDELASSYLSEFLPRLIKLTKSKCMTVRILSLNCIGRYANADFMNLHELLPHKEYVINNVGNCLDDHKRLVRREAVDTRLKWYLLGAPI